MAGGGSLGGRFVGIAVAVLCAVWALTGPGSGTAHAAGGSCAEQVLRDWTDNGRIDGLYPSTCYVDAIANLPEDVRTYSSAVDDISRAMETSQRRAAVEADTHGNAKETRTARRLSSEDAGQVAAQTPSSLQGPPPALLAVVGIAALVATSGLLAYFFRRSRDAP